MKRRIIRPNKRSFTGRHVGKRGTATVAFESGLERDFLTLIRFREDFRDVVEQPFTMAFSDSAGRSRSYTPDFKVTFSKRSVVYEVKYRDELRKNWDRYREPFCYMRSWTRSQGMAFRLVTDLTIRTVRFENVRLISPFVHQLVPEEMSSRIKQALGDETITILDLLKRVCRDDTERPAFYTALWSMLAHRMLTADLNMPLGMQAIVGVNR